MIKMRVLRFWDLFRWPNTQPSRPERLIAIARLDRYEREARELHYTLLNKLRGGSVQ